MLNWGDKDAAERLSTQLRDLLKDRTMTFDQLASCYSIKHGQSVTQRLKEMSRDKRPMLLGDFITLMNDFFEKIGKNQVRAKPAENGGGAAAKPDSLIAKSAAKPVNASEGYPKGSALASPPPAADASVATVPAAEEKKPAVTVMKYADVSRGIQNILKEQHEPVSISVLEDLFKQAFATSISDVVGMSTGEYLQRKENIFDYSPVQETVFLQSATLAGPPMADPKAEKDEAFVVREFASLIEAMGPVVYISTLCGKFIQRNGISVTSIINTRPLDLFKRHPGVFLIVGAGHVTLKKYEHMREVARLLDKPSSKAQRIAKAAEEAQLPVPEVVTEEHVVDEFRRLILNDATDSVYISSLCGRFLQRFKKPVNTIINCKPAEFLRRYPDVFVMTGGGNVGLREVLGPDAVSVPPPPPRVPKALREEQHFSSETLAQIELTEQVYLDIHTRLAQETTYQSVVQRLMAVCRQMETASFLALEELVLGGAAGKGLLTSGTQAEIVLFVRQLPYRNFDQWLPHILETLAPVLEHQLASQKADGFKVEKDHLKFYLRGNGANDILVQVFLSPVFKGREHLLECIKATPPAERFYFYPTMVKERNEFVGRQSHEVKVMIRLLTWWAFKQRWQSALATPSDWLLELVVIHAFEHFKNSVGVDAKKYSLVEMMAHVLEVCANFESVKVLWADIGAALYTLQDIWKPLLSHEPLFMDPLNPYCNLVDVNTFDAHDLVAAAQQPGGFLTFKREAARFLPMADGEEEDNAEDEGA